MYRPCFATPLCFFFALSFSVACFSATAHGETGTRLFERFKSPKEIPDSLVTCPGYRPTALSEVMQRKFAGHNGPILLFLWAPSCPECEKEFQQIDQLAPSLKAAHLPVMTLIQDPRASVTQRTFQRAHAIRNLELCYDLASTAMQQLGAQSLPATFYLSPKGKIIAVHKGALDWSALIASVSQARP